MALNPSYKKKIVNGSVDEPKRIVMPKLPNTNFVAISEVLNDTELNLSKQVIQASTDDARELRKKNAVAISSKSSVLHRVKPNQNLTQIANLYQVEVQDLKVQDNLKSKTLVLGKLLKVFIKSKAIVKPETKFVQYKVKTGDTLSDIAVRFEDAMAQKIKEIINWQMLI